MANFFTMILELIFICGALIAAGLAICAVIFAAYTVGTVHYHRRVAVTGDFDLDKWCTKIFAYVAWVCFLGFLSGVISIVLYISYRNI